MNIPQTYDYCQVDVPKTTVVALAVSAVAVSFAVLAVPSRPADRTGYAAAVAVEASSVVFASFVEVV